MKKTSWSRNDKIGMAGVAIAIVACASAFFIPEVRRFVGLEKPATAQALPAQVQTSAAPSAVAPSQAAPSTPAPPPPKPQAAQHSKVVVKGNGNVAGNNVAGSGNVVGNENKVNAPATGPITQGPGSALSIGQQGGVTVGTMIASPNVVYNYDGTLKRTGPAWNTRLDIRDPDATVVKIRSELAAGQEQEALSDAQGLMTSDPLWATPHILAGLAYVNLGNQDAAKTELQKARSLVPAAYEYEQDYIPHLRRLEDAIVLNDPKPPSR